MNRRTFLTTAASTAASLAVGCTSTDDTPRTINTTTTPTTAPPVVPTTEATPAEPTVNEFFSALNAALDAGADIPFDGNDDAIYALTDALAAAGWPILRWRGVSSPGGVEVRHPDGRHFRFVK